MLILSPCENCESRLYLKSFGVNLYEDISKQGMIKSQQLSRETFQCHQFRHLHYPTFSQVLNSHKSVHLTQAFSNVYRKLGVGVQYTLLQSQCSL